MNVKNSIKKYWLLLVILIAAGTLRFFGLLSNPISLFSDEVDMGYQAYSLIKTGCDYSGFCLPVQFHSFSDVQPPIPIYLISLFNILGINLDLSIRLVSAIFGTLGVLTTFLLVENLISKKIFNLNLPQVGIFSAAVIAFVPWHLTYSRIGFSLALLYFFVTLGSYLFTQFLIKEKYVYFYLSVITLGFTPMVYNTAKMAIFFYPFLLFLLPNALSLINKKIVAKIFLLFLFVPFLVMLVEGGTASRFNYISIFTDPTAKSEVDQQRLRDSGPFAKVGVQTSLFSKLFHNKPLFYFEKLINNYYELTSTNFLFINGDPNLRHSPKNWGQIYKSMLLPIAIGIYFLIRYRHNQLLAILMLFSVISLSTSAITRDGGAHASRSFMFLLPLVIIAGIGISFVCDYSKFIFVAIITLFFVETSFFVHNYWFHYRYESEGAWSSGMRELVQKAGSNTDLPVVISPKNENPLIFYAYYNRFSPKRFQDFVKSNTVFNSTAGNGNLDGARFGDTNLYIASLIDFKNKKPDQFNTATYYITKLEYINTDLKTVAKNSDIIKLQSGEPLYYEFKY